MITTQMVEGTYTLVITRENEAKPPLKLDFLASKKAALILRAINHKLRQQILRMLNENHRLTVTEIYTKLRLEQSVASQHLAILRRAGIVTTDRDGKFIWYKIDKERVGEIIEFIDRLLA